MQKREEKTNKNPMGRPRKYTQELGDFICEIISTTSFGLPKICEFHEFLPHESTVRKWRLDFPDFSAKYARAKLAQADILAEECLEIADNSVNENYTVDRLRIDTRKWLASKLLPKQYGDRVLLEQKTEENDKLREELLTLRSELDARNKKEF